MSVSKPVCDIVTICNFFQTIVHFSQVVMRQFLSGLAYLHSWNITHGDLRPQNILITPGVLNLKITGYGDAKLSQYVEAQRHKPRGVDQPVFPTPGFSLYYKSPEAFLEKVIAAPGDVWACGAILAEILTGSMSYSRHNFWIASFLQLCLLLYCSFSNLP